MLEKSRVLIVRNTTVMVIKGWMDGRWSSALLLGSGKYFEFWDDAKSGLRRPVSFTILGYGFVSTYKKGEKGRYQLVASKKALARFKLAAKEITRKTIPMSFDERIHRLKLLQTGGVNYFKLANMHGKLKKLDEWLRNRLRYCIWHHWKRPERKRKNLLRLGVPKGQAYAWSRTRMGGWAVACSPMLRTTITIARLEKRKYVSLLNHYQKVSHV